LRHLALIGMASLPFATAPVGGGIPVVRLASWGLPTSSLDVCSQLEFEGLFSAADLSACSVLRWPGLLGTPRCGAGQRRRTTLAASAARGDLACSGSRWGCSARLNFPGAVQLQVTARATSLDF
jgi:hypothetical protein